MALKLFGASLTAGLVPAVATVGTTATTAVTAAIRSCAASPILCVNSVGIVGADAATGGAIGTGALAAGAATVATEVELAAQDVKAVGIPAPTGRSSVATPSLTSMDQLLGQTLAGPTLSHTPGVQNGVLGEAVGLQTLDKQTGLSFTPFQNSSGNGADGLAIDVTSKTIWVAEVKSSQNGAAAAASAQGDPAAKLDTWLSLSESPEGTAWIAQPPSNSLLVQRIQDALNSGYEVKGVQVQVGVPAPGATGTTSIAIRPWKKP